MSTPQGSVLYVLLDFPIRSERFIAREIRALERLGARIQILTLRARPGPTTDPAPRGLEILRPPGWWNPRLWLTALRTGLVSPRSTLRLFSLAHGAESRMGTECGPASRARELRMVALALHFITRLRRCPPTMIHAHFGSTPASLALLIAAGFDRPFGFSVHASDLYAEPNHLRFKARRASHVLTCSEIAREDLRRRLGDQQVNLQTVHHGLDLDLWAPGKPDRESNLAKPPRIAAIGRFTAKKGLGYLVEACAILHSEGFDFSCEIMGDGEEKGFLHQKIAELGLRSRVHIRPWRSPDILRRDLRQVSVLAVPSVIAATGDRDNLPNVMIEALACGTPVVASALPALERLLGPSRAARLVPPGEPRALADALREVCNDPDLAERLRARGHRLVEEQFDAHKNASKIFDIFQHSASR